MFCSEPFASVLMGGEMLLIFFSLPSTFGFTNEPQGVAYVGYFTGDNIKRYYISSPNHCKMSFSPRRGARTEKMLKNDLIKIIFFNNNSSYRAVISSLIATWLPWAYNEQCHQYDNLVGFHTRVYWVAHVATLVLQLINFFLNFCPHKSAKISP